MVENNKVTVADLAQVISYVTPEIRHEFPEQLKVLEELHYVLVPYADPEGRSDTHSIRMLWDEDNTRSPDARYGSASASHEASPYDTIVLNEHNDSSRDRIGVRSVTSLAVSGCNGAVGILRSEGQ